MTETRRSDLVAAMQRICTAIVAAAAVTLLAACTAGPGGKKASDDDTDETPEVTKPKPSLLGTWRGTDDWYKHDDRTDDYYVAGTEMITLTFTKGTLYRGALGNIVRRYGIGRRTSKRHMGDNR